MEAPFFKTQMQLLTADFGPEEYTNGRIALIWETCNDLPDSSFAKIIRHFRMTKSVKYPPLPQHFFEEAINQRKLLNSQKRNIISIEGNQSPDQPTRSLNEILGEMGFNSLAEAVRGKSFLKKVE